MLPAEKYSFQLGPFRIEHPFILAPMAGITNSAFRRLMRRRKSSLVISELVSANAIEYGARKTLDLLRYHDEERVVGIQIFGEDPKLLCKAAQYVERAGADFIDLNLGCPVSKVVRRGAGAALCRDSIALGKILNQLVKSVRIPVTIKIRTGWDASSRNALDVVNAATDAGVTWVAVHGRTRAQGYSGEADWDTIGQVKKKSSIPIIGNGDITTPELAIQRIRDYGVDAILIGRGALRNPFIFEQTLALWKGGSFSLPTSADYLELIEEQFALLREGYDSNVAMLHARKFFSWYSSGHSGCHEFRSKIFRLSDPEELWLVARLFFEKCGQERDFRFLAQPFLMGGHG